MSLEMNILRSRNGTGTQSAETDFSQFFRGFGSQNRKKYVYGDVMAVIIAPYLMKTEPRFIL